MNVPTLTMDVDLAQQKYDIYKSALESRETTEEDKNILLGYKALAAGKQILNIFDVFSACPVDEKGFPKLAIARAHWKWCFHRDAGWGENARAVFGSTRQATNSQRGPGNISIPRSRMPQGWKVASLVRAMVPIIPAPLRPRSNLAKYVILFEAEWQPIAPKDPLLLRRLSGSLYVILAAWDLTDLERAVLAGRFLESAS